MFSAPTHYFLDINVVSRINSYLIKVTVPYAGCGTACAGAGGAGGLAPAIALPML